MFERIVSPLVLRRTIIGSEAARVMPKSLERTATRISKNQEISSLFLVCNAINVVVRSKDSHLVHKNMAFGEGPGQGYFWSRSVSYNFAGPNRIAFKPLRIASELGAWQL